MNVFIRQKGLIKTLKTWCSLSVRVFVDLSTVKLSLALTILQPHAKTEWQYWQNKFFMESNTASTAIKKSALHVEVYKIINSILWSLLSLPKIGEMKLKVVRSSTSNSDKLWGLSIGYMNTQPYYQPAKLNNRVLCETVVRYTYEEVHTWHWVKFFFSKLCGADNWINREVHLLR